MGKNLNSGEINSERWIRMSFSEQMGNIGSEVFRTISWQEKKNKENKENSLWRVLEMLDLTISIKKNRELLRLREVLCDLFLGKNIYRVSLNFLKNYFIQFASAANRNKQ